MAAGLFIAATPNTGLADSGRVELSTVWGETRITVFSTPTPLRIGEVDIAVLLQNEETGTVLRDQEIVVSCQCQSSDTQVERAATHEQSTNKLLHCARLHLSEAGNWNISIKVGDQIEATTAFVVKVSPPLLIPSGIWLIALSPLGFILLYLIRERIAGRSWS